MNTTEEYISGYQYSPTDNRFIGEYKFPKNRDGNEIHLPPNTTLTKPPRKKLREGEFFKWSGKRWDVAVETSN